MTAYNYKHPYEPDWQIPLGVWASGERWACIWGDGQGAGAMERYMGRWAGRGSDQEVYGAMDRARALW